MARKTRKPAAAAVATPATPAVAFEIRNTASGRAYARVTVGNWSANLTGAHLRILLENREACDGLLALEAYEGMTAPAPVAPAPAPVQAPAPVAPAAPVQAPIGNTHAAPPAKAPVSPELLARAKAAHVKAAHLYRDAAKLQAAIDAKAPAAPAKAPAPAPAAPTPTLVASIVPSKSSPAPVRIESHPEPKYLTTSYGADGKWYAIFQNANGTLEAREVAESQVA
jgi:hypothetical protein